MNRGQAGNRVNKAQTGAAVRGAASEIRGALGRGKTEPAPRPTNNGLNWLIALGAGAAVAWKSWKAAKEPPADGRNNVTANGAASQAMAKQVSEQKTGGNAPQKSDAQASETRHISGRGTGDASAAAPTGTLALAKEFYKRVNEDELTTRAAALAFVVVLSLVPILLFAIIALGFVFRDPAEASRHVQHFVAQMLPGESASSAAEDVLTQTHLIETAQNMTRHVGLPLVIGIGSLLWAGISLFVTASTPMDTAWDVTETRSFLQLRLTALGLLLGAGLVLLLSLSASALPDLVSSLDWPLFGAKGDVPLAWHLVFALLAVAFDVLMFVLVYKYLPNAPVSWRAALFSGVLTGLTWEAFKQAFGLYLAHFGNSTNKMYGALAGVVLLITWIYYSCIVLLFGAIAGKMYNEHREEGGVKSRPTVPARTSAAK